MLRIFQRDAERTFITKGNAELNARTQLRQQQQVENLQLVHCAVDGYHQGLGYMVAFLQLFLDDTDLLRIVRTLHTSPRHSAGYFCAAPEAFVRDARAMTRLLQEDQPAVAEHLTKVGIVPEMYAVKWFIGLCVHVLPLLQLLDFWEGFFQYGCEFICCFGLAFMREFAAEILAEQNTAGVMAILRMEEPAAEWRFPAQLQDVIEKRLAMVNLAALDLIAEDAIGVDRLAILRRDEASKVAQEVALANRRAEELETDDDKIVFSDEEAAQDSSGKAAVF